MSEAAFEQRCGVGAVAEAQVIEALQAAGWACCPFGLARANSPPARLLLPDGSTSKTVDIIAWPPTGKKAFYLEVKSKNPLFHGGFGLDVAEWDALRLHDKYAGSTVLIVLNRTSNRLVYATVSRLIKSQPSMSRNGSTVMWPAIAFWNFNSFLDA